MKSTLPYPTSAVTFMQAFLARLHLEAFAGSLHLQGVDALHALFAECVEQSLAFDFLIIKIPFF